MEKNLETKFIEGTNQQYSIRNDGVVIKHYKRQRISNTLTIIIPLNTSVTILKEGTVSISFIGKVKRVSANKLLLKYFGFNYCMQCNNKYTSELKQKSDIICKKCSNNNRIIASNRYMQQCTETLTKNYIANSLQMKVKDLNEELYEAAKTRILIKRKIKQLQNGK